MKKIILLILSILCVSWVYADNLNSNPTANKGNLTVNISGIIGDQGVIRFALFNSKESYEDAGKFGVMPPFYEAQVTQINSDGTASLVVNNIPYGEYAFKMFHDQDGSGKLKTTWFGTPKEEVGFSNSPDAKNGTPKYFLVKFQFDPSHTVQNVKMQSFK